MEDRQIVELYHKRSERAIRETQKKYGSYCYTVAYRILADRLDSEECVNDTYLKAWNAIPPEKPHHLCAFLAKITRNLALNRYSAKTAQKRGGAQVEIAMDELLECIPDSTVSVDATEEILLRAAINRFLRALPEETMIVFLQRYWYFASVREIARNRGLSEANVKVMLHRAREKFKQQLEQEGIVL